MMETLAISDSTGETQAHQPIISTHNLWNHVTEDMETASGNKNQGIFFSHARFPTMASLSELSQLLIDFLAITLSLCFSHAAVWEVGG